MYGGSLLLRRDDEAIVSPLTSQAPFQPFPNNMWRPMHKPTFHPLLKSNTSLGYYNLSGFGSGAANSCAPPAQQLAVSNNKPRSVKIPADAYNRMQNVFQSVMDTRKQCLLPAFVAALRGDALFRSMMNRTAAQVPRMPWTQTKAPVDILLAEVESSILSLPTAPPQLQASSSAHVTSASWAFCTSVSWAQFVDLLRNCCAGNAGAGVAVLLPSTSEWVSAERRAEAASSKSAYQQLLDDMEPLHGLGGFGSAGGEANFHSSPLTPPSAVSSSGSGYYADRVRRMREEQQTREQQLQASMTASKQIDDIFNKVEQRMAAKAERQQMEVDSEESCDDEEGQGAAQSEAERVRVLLEDRRRPPTAEELATLHRIRSQPEDFEVVAEKFNIPMTRAQFACLNPGRWLNDEVISFCMAMLKERNDAIAQLCAEQGTPFAPSHFFNNFFVNKLMDNEGGQYNYSYVRRWTKKVDIFAMDRVYCPINIANTHWTLAVIHMQQRRIVYYDSMGARGTRYLEGLMRFVKDDHLDKKKTPLPDPDSWTLVPGSRSGCPQQSNGIDCGLFTILCADHMSDDLPLDSYCQADISSFWRDKIGTAILRGSLDYTVLPPTCS